jgi:antitoxin component of MazEF toxin-antitoxin module
MVTTIAQVGDSPSVSIDPSVLEQAHLKVGDQVSIGVDEEGTITLSPVRAMVEDGRAAVTARELIQRNSELFRRLS